MYYGGEGVSVEQPQSLTCPYCTRMGFTEATLQEHVAADHPDTSFEVVCILKGERVLFSIALVETFKM